MHVGRLAEVPDGAGAGYDEDGDGLEESVGPEGGKDEVVEVAEGGRGVGLDAGEDVGAVDHKLGSPYEGHHRVEAEHPQGKHCGPHDHRNQHDLAGGSHELSGNSAESHCEADSSAAADDDEADDAEEAETDPAEDVVVAEGGKVGDADAEVACKAGLADGSSVVEEEDSGSGQEEDHQEERDPDEAACEALQEGHEKDREKDGQDQR